MDKDSFRAEEWALLRQAPQLVALAVSLAHPTTIALVLEGMAARRALDKLRETHSSNPLVVAVLSDLGEAPRVDDWSEEACRAAADETIAQLREVARIVDERGAAGSYRKGNPAHEFRVMLLSLAKAVATASGEGVVGPGPRVSPRETAMIERIRKALEV